MWDLRRHETAYVCPELSGAGADVGSWVSYGILSCIGTAVEEWVGVGIVHNHWGVLDRCAKRALIVIVIAEAGCIGWRYMSLQGDIYCIGACGCTTCHKCRAWARVSRVSVDRRPLYTPKYVLRGHIANA